MAKHHKHNILTTLIAIIPIWVIAIVFSVFFCKCSNDNNTITPRRKSYPRITTHDSIFTPITNGELKFEISTTATISLDSVNDSKSRWLNTFYKPYNTTIYYTFTPIKDNLEEVINNRTQRISLNTGSYTSELIELTNVNGFKSQLIITPESQVTPLQFLSTDGKDWVISGALYINQAPNSNPDSIKPILNVLKRDMIHTLKTIGK